MGLWLHEGLQKPEIVLKIVITVTVVRVQLLSDSVKSPQLWGAFPFSKQSYNCATSREP